jgi:hypothetical protein
MLHIMSGLKPLPLDPRVPARDRARFASRFARRCCLAERRLVGGTLPPEDERPLGRFDVIVMALVRGGGEAARQVRCSAAIELGFGVRT